MLPSIFDENVFDDLFDQTMNMDMFGRRNPLYGKHAKDLMKTDVRETEDSYVLDIDLPGFKKDELQVELENGYLTIRAEKGLDKDETDKKGRYIRQERYAGALSRSCYVGEGFTVDDMHAKFENGILQISVPKEAPKALPKKNVLSIE